MPHRLHPALQRYARIRITHGIRRYVGATGALMFLELAACAGDVTPTQPHALAARGVEAAGAGNAPAGWAERAPAQIARFGSVAVTAGSVLYAIGGAAPNGVLRTVEAYDPAADSWSPRAPSRRGVRTRAGRPSSRDRST